MEQPDSPPAAPIISDRVRLNGTVTPLSLSEDGRLVWTDAGQRCLRFEKEVLGFTAEGSGVRIRAAVDLDGAGCCTGPGGGGGGRIVRKELVFEPLSAESFSLWCQKLQDYLDSLGIVSGYHVWSNFLPPELGHLDPKLAFCRG